MRRPLRGEHAGRPRARRTARCTGPRTCSPRRGIRSCWPGRAWRATALTDALIRFSERLNMPVATTFLGKGVFPDDHPNALGTIGFMVKDYANFGFDRADVVVAVGYDLVEYSPSRWNPLARQADRARAPDRRRGGRELHPRGRAAGRHRRDARCDRRRRACVQDVRGGDLPVRDLVREELERGAADDAFPLAPARIVADIRAVLGARGHRAVRHGCREDVDGAPVSDLSRRTPASSRTGSPRWRSRCPARSPPSSCTPSARCWRRWATAPS